MTQLTPPRPRASCRSPRTHFSLLPPPLHLYLALAPCTFSLLSPVLLLALQDDLACLPAKMAASCGNLGPLVLVTRVTNQITIADPLTLRSHSMDVSAPRAEAGGKERIGP